MFEWIADPQAWMALATLTLLEIVLGIDNIIFLTILVNRMPPEMRNRTRLFGLGFAMITRIMLLLSLAWVMSLTQPFFEILGKAISGRDLILIGGGLFLLWKASTEIYNSMEGSGEDGQPSPNAGSAAFFSIVLQIAVIDIVFSLDSVITAVGLAKHVSVMVIAIMISVGVMMFAAKSIGEFVESHPSIKVLALSFLVLVGTLLVAEGFGQHVSKGYVYFAMAFSLGVEMLNLRVRKRDRDPVKLHGPKGHA